MRSHNGSPSARAATGSVTFTISVEELLEVVKKTYPELLPDEVREHYGIVGGKDENAHYSLKTAVDHIEKYGVIPRGEKAAREVSVPKKTDDTYKVSQTV